MFQLVYVSSSVGLLSKQQLLDLLVKSRTNNARRGITGMLLYRDGNIIQVLEGEEAPVKELYERISRDPRHRGIIVLLQRTITQREFPEWSMGFRDLNSPEVAALPGYSEFMNLPLNADVGADRAGRLLKVFKANP